MKRKYLFLFSIILSVILFIFVSNKNKFWGAGSSKSSIFLALDPDAFFDSLMKTYDSILSKSFVQKLLRNKQPACIGTPMQLEKYSQKTNSWQAIQEEPPFNTLLKTVKPVSDRIECSQYGLTFGIGPRSVFQLNRSFSGTLIFTLQNGGINLYLDSKKQVIFKISQGSFELITKDHAVIQLYCNDNNKNCYMRFAGSDLNVLYKSSKEMGESILTIESKLGPLALMNTAGSIEPRVYPSGATVKINSMGIVTIKK